jgi:hypothetical protein
MKFASTFQQENTTFTTEVEARNASEALGFILGKAQQLTGKENIDTDGKAYTISLSKYPPQPQQ